MRYLFNWYGETRVVPDGERWLVEHKPYRDVPSWYPATSYDSQHMADVFSQWNNGEREIDDALYLDMELATHETDPSRKLSRGTFNIIMRWDLCDPDVLRVFNIYMLMDIRGIGITKATQLIRWLSARGIELQPSDYQNELREKGLL